MARCLLAWELGGGLGHALPLARLAAELLERGHEVHLAWRDLSAASQLLGDRLRSPRLQLWQAPLWLARLQGGSPPVSYPELLFHAGYLDAAGLQGLARAWASLLAAIRPQLLLADHAPTALLAARGRPLRRALMGDGFFQPPALSPMPAWRDAGQVPAARLHQGEALALASCNAVLRACGQPPLAALHELLAHDALFLLSWPELDPYGAQRPAGSCLGPLPPSGVGAAPDWPAGDGPRWLAYLKPEHPALARVLQALAAAPLRTLVAGARLPAALREGLPANLRIVDGPLAMDAALAQADAVACHAGAGTVAAALQAGRPLLLLPMQAEQAETARRVQRLGAGLALPASADAGPLAAAVRALSAPQSPQRQAAQALARQRGAQRLTLAGLAQRCEALLDADDAGH